MTEGTDPLVSVPPAASPALNVAWKDPRRKKYCDDVSRLHFRMPFCLCEF